MRGAGLVLFVAACGGGGDDPGNKPDGGGVPSDGTTNTQPITVTVTGDTAGTLGVGLHVLFRDTTGMVQDVVTDANGVAAATTGNGTVASVVHSSQVIIAYGGLRPGDSIVDDQSRPASGVQLLPQPFASITPVSSGDYNIAGTSGVHGSQTATGTGALSVPLAALDGPLKKDASVIAWTTSTSGEVEFATQAHVDLTTGAVAFGSFHGAPSFAVTAKNFPIPYAGATITVANHFSAEPGSTMHSFTLDHLDATGSGAAPLAPFGDLTFVAGFFEYANGHEVDYASDGPVSSSATIDGTHMPKLAGDAQWGDTGLTWSDIGSGGEDPTMLAVVLTAGGAEIVYYAPYTASGSLVFPPLPSSILSSSLQLAGAAFFSYPGVAYLDSLKRLDAPTWRVKLK